MAPVRAPALALLAIALAVAGCISSPASPQPVASDGPAPAWSTAAAFPRVELAECTEGGGHSNYNLADLEAAGIMPEPWVLADVSDDIGPVTITNTVPPTPATGPQSGIYHAAFRCESWTLDGAAQDGALQGGYVGIRIEAPPFDAGPMAARHYLVVTFATDSEAVNQALADAGLGPGQSQVTVGMMGPLFHSVFDEVDHGVYEAHFQPVEAGPKEDGIVRIWLQHGAGHHGDFSVQNHDSGIHPRALDLLDAGGSHFHAQDATAAFSHTRTSDHDQDLGLGVPVPLPGVAGQTAGLGYAGFTRVLLPGPQPAVSLSEPWVHQ